MKVTLGALFLIFLTIGPVTPVPQNSKPDFNNLDYQNWYKESMDEKSGFGDVGAIYLVKNAPADYRPGMTFQKNDLMRLKGEIFYNHKTLEIIFVIYDVDQKTPIFSAYVEDISRLEDVTNLKIFYRLNGRWQPVPEEIAKLGPGTEVFDYFYKKTGKLICFFE